MMDSLKQTSLQNLQGGLDRHMETASGQVRAHQAQQALSLHKVDMEASVMEVIIVYESHIVTVNVISGFHQQRAN